MNCRHCNVSLTETFLDLGFAPPSNAYLTAIELSKPEKYFPLKVMVFPANSIVYSEGEFTVPTLVLFLEVSVELAGTVTT